MKLARPLTRRKKALILVIGLIVFAFHAVSFYAFFGELVLQSLQLDSGSNCYLPLSQM